MSQPDIVLATVECARWDYRTVLSPDADLGVHRGIAAGHYTRPSLAAIHSPTWASVIDTRVRGPTLAETLAQTDYRTEAIAYSPQTTAAFGFDRGFDEARLCEPDGGRLGRGSRLREKLGGVAPVRWLHDRVRGKHAVFDGIPTDERVVEQARTSLDESEREGHQPLFLWIHFMGSHRPYGWGDDSLPERVSHDLARARPRPDWHPVRKWIGRRDPGDLREVVEPYYTRSLERISGYLSGLIDATTDDTVWLICGDHGEELGEEGYFLHSGYRRRVVDSLVTVPVFTRGLSLDGPVSLLDLPAHLTGAGDVEPPEEWDTRPGRESYLTVAPWDGTATVRYQTPETGTDLRFEAAAVDRQDTTDVSRDVRSRLQALGYRGVG